MRCHRGFLLCCALLLAGPVRAVHIADEQVAVEQRDGVYVARLAVQVPVPPLLAQTVLTDFEHMPDFIPGLEESRVLARGERRWHLAQRGVARFGPFRLGFTSERLVELLADGRIVSTGLAGVRKMRSEVRLQATAGGTLLDYRLELLPEQWIPASLGVNFMQHELAGQFTALTQEMERRLQAGRTP